MPFLEEPAIFPRLDSRCRVVLFFPSAPLSLSRGPRVKLGEGVPVRDNEYETAILFRTEFLAASQSISSPSLFLRGRRKLEARSSEYSYAREEATG